MKLHSDRLDLGSTRCSRYELSEMIFSTRAMDVAKLLLHNPETRQITAKPDGRRTGRELLQSIM